jgi:ABC-type uncharacterized transport system substrate-binding protein
MFRNRFKQLGLVLLVFVGLSSVLLILDWNNREKSAPGKLTKIAIFKISTRILLEDTEKGVLESLEKNGFIHGENCLIERFSAEGDMPTANTIAQNIVGKGFDMVITISTPALQIMANANREGKVIHVFCTVTDPYISGVGITGIEPHQHPKHLVGMGTFQPVEKVFDIAKKMNPGLKRVGCVWCNSEVCSEACTRKARKKCAELGIELVEATVDNPTQVLEAARSVTARGVEAMWLGGDNVVESAADQLFKACAEAKIPLFNHNPYTVYGNLLFALGADYTEVGRAAGNMACEILRGKKTTEYGVNNLVPDRLVINTKALQNIKGDWDISAFLSEGTVY